MKFLLALLFITPLLTYAQKKEKEPAEKLGPHPIYIIDSVKFTREEFMNFDPNTITSLTIVTDTDATNKFGPNSKDGVIIIQTKGFARKHYISYFRKRSPVYDSLYTITKSDSTFQYIINDKMKNKNFEGDLARIDDWLFLSLELVTADDLKKNYNVSDKKIGVLIKCRIPQDVFNGQSKF